MCESVQSFCHKESSKIDCRNASVTQYSSSVVSSPSPQHFDEFLPWACLMWQTPKTVVVTRVVQEDYKSSAFRRASSAKSAKSERSIQSSCVKLKHDAIACEVEEIIAKTSTPAPDTNLTDDKTCIPIKAHYDPRGNLVQLSITGCPINIHIKVIQAIILCAKYHPLLTKLTIRYGGLTSITINEIGKLLTLSNLTEICMDDSYVPEENYYVLLEHASKIKTLSLKRCRLNDLACEKIAAKLHCEGSGYSLLTLEMGSNRITDVGARTIGDMLRHNRRLLHLGLSDNAITDEGAFFIFKHLVEFPLTSEEILESKRKIMKYLKSKIELSNRNLTTVSSHTDVETTANYQGHQFLAENVSENIGFQDPFGPKHVAKRNGIYYCYGNMILCSLNLAFNDLSYISVKKLNEVVKYQDTLSKLLGTTRLLRVVIDGNNLPKSCSEYLDIESRLTDSILKQAPKTRPPSVTLKKSSKTLNSRKVSYSGLMDI